MSNSNSKPTCNHMWGNWISYDSYVIEFGLTNGFHYYRKCMHSGCFGIQYAESLVPTGKVETHE